MGILSFFKRKLANQQIDYFIRKIEDVDFQTREKLWLIYNNSFSEKNKLAPCQQSIKNKNDFINELKKDSVNKYILKKEGEIIGLALTTNDLSNCTWISENYFKKQYPEHYNNKNLYYFMGIAIKKEYRNMGLAVKLIESIIDDIPNNAVMGFDHSYKTNRFIPYFTNVIKQKKSLRRKFLDKQVYYLITKK